MLGEEIIEFLWKEYLLDKRLDLVLSYCHETTYFFPTTGSRLDFNPLL